jgi:hypothetical protein
MKQGIFEQSVTQKYPLGMRLARDNRLFRYSQATQALAGLARLVINSNFAPGCTAHVNEDGFEGAIGFAASVGQAYLDIADTSGRAANWYQGGMVIVYGTTIFHQYYIVKSDAGDGSKVRLYLSSSVAVEAITATMGCTAYRSPYSAVKTAGSTGVGFEPFIGVNLIPVTIDYFFWLQTAGLCIVTPTGVTWPGSAANLRAVYANPADGTLQPATISDPSAGYQYIGDLVEATVNAYGDLLINLRLDPTM